MCCCFTFKGGEKRNIVINTTRGEAASAKTSPGLSPGFRITSSFSECLSSWRLRSCRENLASRGSFLRAGEREPSAPRRPRAQQTQPRGRAPRGGSRRAPLRAREPEPRAAQPAPAYPRVLMKPLTEPSAYRDTMSPM